MKKLLYIILALLVVYFILALFGPSKVVVERSIAVNKSLPFVKNQLGRLEFFHSKWSPWTERDPSMTVKFSGEPGAAGHKMEWSSKVDEVGTGTLEIVGVADDTLIMKLIFEGMGDSKAYYVVNEKEGATNVTWGMEMKSPFLFRPMMMFMNMDKMIGPDYEKGLAKFKKELDGMADQAPNTAANYEIKEIEWPETYYVSSKKENMEVMNVADFFGKNWMKMMGQLEKNKIKTGYPVGIYSNFDGATMKADVAAAFKVDKGVKASGFESFTIPASKVISVTYMGDYAKMINAYQAMDAYMASKGVTNEMSIEEYVTDPMMEKDTAKWVTNIYYILK